MLTRSIAALLFCTAAATAQAQTQDWEKQWNAWVAAAKQEGKVVILAPPDPQVRQALPDAFKARYGITVEELGGRTSESGTKVRAERQTHDDAGQGAPADVHTPAK